MPVAPILKTLQGGNLWFNMLDEIPSFVKITPFGAYCHLCVEPLTIQKGIFNHGKSFHSDILFKNATVIRQVQRKLAKLRNVHSMDLTQFLKESGTVQMVYFCSGCFTSFTKTSNYKRHMEVRDNNCSVGILGKVACYPTICGRLGPKSCGTQATLATTTIVPIETVGIDFTEPLLQTDPTTATEAILTSMVPAALMITQDEAAEFLAPFVRDDENVSDLTLIYYPLLRPGFEGIIRHYLGYSMSQLADEPILTNWIEAGRLWLTCYAAGHVANVSANVRSRLAEFEEKEIDGVMLGSRTFTLRRGIPRLLGELESALRFFYRYPTTIFDQFKTDEVKNADATALIHMAIIPKILFIAATEEPEDHGRIPITCEYCLTRGFNIKDGSKLVMNECGYFSSRISAVMHLLRAGVCGYLVTLSLTTPRQLLTVQEMQIVNNVQNGRVTNLLGPYVRRLRDLSGRKPPLKDNTVCANGDITSGAFTFAKTVWSTIIPRVVELSKLCFQKIYENDKWLLFINDSLTMADWVQLEASVTVRDFQIRLCELQIKKNVEPILARLQSVGELCLFGLGVGAVRHEEVSRLTVSSCQWHNGYLYFWSESLKQGSMKRSRRPKMVEHRLSLTLSKVFVLLRRAMMASGVSDEKILLPALPGASMLCLVRDIFDFDVSPQMLNVRHLFTSIGNILHPEENSRYDNGGIVSAAQLTGKSGHTQSTGRRSYSTHMENSEEVLYDLYHSNLGETNLDPPLFEFIPFSHSLLKESLKELLGRKADYRSPQQKEMIYIAANSILRHAYCGLPCGQGKSLSWMVPTMASYISGRQVGLRIVILPYKFLLGHMLHHATSMIGILNGKLHVKCLDSSQITEDSVPAIFEEDELPNLLFMNLDGASTLLRFHVGLLQRLSKKNILKRIYIDEIQQLIPEFGFRSSYQAFREIGRIGVPVMCLSGSLPISLASSLMSYCRLQDDSIPNSIEIIKGFDPIGTGFTFGVKITTFLCSTIIDFVKTHRVGACHVICETKKLVERVVKGLPEYLKVLSVTGDSSFEDQKNCARNWFMGGHDVLVTTVVALVGNENRLCNTIVIGGFLFNISSLVQAIGRLRPEQRGQNSQVQVIRLPITALDRYKATKDADDKFVELKTSNCLDDSLKETYHQIFSPLGLQKLLSMKEGCYLKQLSSLYDFARSDCLRCSLCRSSKELKPGTLHDPVNSISKTCIRKRAASPNFHENSFKTTLGNQSISHVRLSKKNSNVKSREERQTRNKAENVFRDLLYRCIVCGRADCNGECVRGCYRCGDRRHQTNVCTYTVERLTKILSGKGVCFGCFDTRQRGIIHKIKECPLQRRLKRLLLLDRERQSISFEEYLRKLYADEMSFLSMVASYSDKVELGR